MWRASALYDAEHVMLCEAVDASAWNFSYSGMLPEGKEGGRRRSESPPLECKREGVAGSFLLSYEVESGSQRLCWDRVQDGPWCAEGILQLPGSEAPQQTETRTSANTEGGESPRGKDRKWTKTRNLTAHSNTLTAVYASDSVVSLKSECESQHQTTEIIWGWRCVCVCVCVRLR